ncbi:alpha-glucosidase family protein [Pelagibius sp.]|uniref:alpha-glucosidase family protein n=1 Tax=Pelagibius sp. TaxID=1931238 RepID=UPI00262646CC|nr:alpha-glucosidase family protein [Pelagibius sp.]
MTGQGAGSKGASRKSAAGGDAEWWRGAVIYQIYPRSFYDASGDGLGDLAGITEKLNHIASLGVDAIWVSPFYKSPMRDFGYDVADYRAVDPLFGTLDDFQQLLGRAHGLGLKVLIDLVLSHTSDEHPWFLESRQSRDNPRAEWYVWADPKPDGTVPNNWLSIFGGSAWAWEPRRRQYYLHNFLTCQPDLNLHSMAVQDQLLSEAAFWLDLGVDGFRLDAVNFCSHDRQLRDNPPLKPGERPTDGVQLDNPYAYQRHLYDKTQPETIDFLKRLRALTDRYEARTTMGEVSGDDSLRIAADYTSGGDRLNMAYTFNLLTSDFSAAHLRDVVAEMESVAGDGWPCWAFSNHDVIRAPSRWAQNADGSAEQAEDNDFARLLMALLLSLRGSVCLYQGEELGLVEAEVPFERLQDPYGKAFWPEFKGRDGCRTPMPWNGSADHAGFSTAEPWLPVDPRHLERAVDRQDHVPGSLLNAYRAFLRWRRRQPALRWGTLRFLETEDPLLAFYRRCPEQQVFAAFNLGGKPASLALAEPGGITPLDGHGFTASWENGRLTLPRYGAFFARADFAKQPDFAQQAENADTKQEETGKGIEGG